jgi:hypothetical protein
MSKNHKIETAKIENGVTEVNNSINYSYNLLLYAAHTIGIDSLDVSIIQYPNKQNGNTAICQAKLETSQGQIFTGIGDASPSNILDPEMTSLGVAAHRAKELVMFDAFNIPYIVHLMKSDEVSEKDNSIETDFVVLKS